MRLSVSASNPLERVMGVEWESIFKPGVETDFPTATVIGLFAVSLR
jgi:hypothetical protein